MRSNPPRLGEPTARVAARVQGSDGAVLNGTGIKVIRTGTGVYTVALVEPMRQMCSVQATVDSPTAGVKLITCTWSNVTDTVTVRIYNTSFAASDDNFSITFEGRR